MSKTIRLTPKQNQIWVNTKTLHYSTCNIYVSPERVSEWVQVERKNLKQFIAEAKAQKEAKVTQTVTE